MHGRNEVLEEPAFRGLGKVRRKNWGPGQEEEGKEVRSVDGERSEG